MSTQDKREPIPGLLKGSTLVLVFTQEGLKNIETLGCTVHQVRIEFTGDRLLARSGISYEEMREMVEEHLTVEKVMAFTVHHSWR